MGFFDTTVAITGLWVLPYGFVGAVDGRLKELRGWGTDEVIRLDAATGSVQPRPEPAAW
jgi:hypothetical protein